MYASFFLDLYGLIGVCPKSVFADTFRFRVAEVFVLDAFLTVPPFLVDADARFPVPVLAVPVLAVPVLTVPVFTLALVFSSTCVFTLLPAFVFFLTDVCFSAAISFSNSPCHKIGFENRVANITRSLKKRKQITVENIVCIFRNPSGHLHAMHTQIEIAAKTTLCLQLFQGQCQRPISAILINSSGIQIISGFYLMESL